jgi:hypothetical protein
MRPSKGNFYRNFPDEAIGTTLGPIPLLAQAGVLTMVRG